MIGIMESAFLYKIMNLLENNQNNLDFVYLVDLYPRGLHNHVLYCLIGFDIVNKVGNQLKWMDTNNIVCFFLIFVVRLRRNWVISCCFQLFISELGMIQIPKAWYLLVNNHFIFSNINPQIQRRFCLAMTKYCCEFWVEVILVSTVLGL